MGLRLPAVRQTDGQRQRRLRHLGAAPGLDGGSGSPGDRLGHPVRDTASRATWLYGNGYRYVGRYIHDPPNSTLDKEIKPGELDTIFAAGLKVFPI
ncbi:glycoside hydrolase domain-containing protein [Streptomyces thermodiastaticus]|nr:glycoside hydrolase domain-containing protein [Streptomyces thermodiastaticus]